MMTLEKEHERVSLLMDRCIINTLANIERAFVHSSAPGSESEKEHQEKWEKYLEESRKISVELKKLED